MQDLDTVLDRYPLCREKLAPLLSANISILSQPFLFSDICNIPCYPYIVEAMKKSHAVCADSWQKFSSRSISSPSNDLIRGRFLAIIVHVAEFLFRSSLACTGNFYRRRCHDVLVFLRSKTTSSCTDRLCIIGSCQRWQLKMMSIYKFASFVTIFVACFAGVQEPHAILTLVTGLKSGWSNSTRVSKWARCSFCSLTLLRAVFVTCPVVQT